MKINTITCHHVYNHGALLQAYALSEFLKGEGHDVSIIDYRPSYLDGHFKLWRSDPRYDRIGLGWAYVLAKLPGRIRSLKRKKAFDAFFDRYMPVTDRIYHSVGELRANPPEADLYIAGSDQIWNTDFKNGIDPAFYLDFGDCRKISYAASFATHSLHEGTENFVKEMLGNFTDISIREQSGLKILNNLGYHGTVVVDPVFLLNKDQWDIIASEDGKNEDYILIYDFERNPVIRELARRYSKLNHCKIYSIGPYRLDYADKCFINYGPDAFVGLIKNAKCVLSNSFHGSAFSMIFQKNFFVANREDGLNERMLDLLIRYNLTDRLINLNIDDQALKSSVSYKHVLPTLLKNIESSKVFLGKQLQSIKNEPT